MLCEKVEPIVNALEKDYAGKMKFAIRTYDEGDAPDLIKKYEMDVHGMVVTDQTGAKQWMLSGHRQTREEVVTAIEKLLQ